MQTLEEDLKNYRNEFLFNSFVMFSSVKRMKKENKNKNNWAYGINAGIISMTLISICLAYFGQKETNFLQGFLQRFGVNLTQDTSSDVSMLATLLAFGLSIAIFIYHKQHDTRIDYNIANSYWLLYKRTQDLINMLDPNSLYCQTFINKELFICKELDVIKTQYDLLVRFSPVFNEDDYKVAKDSLSEGRYLYHTPMEIEEILAFFKKK